MASVPGDHALKQPIPSFTDPRSAAAWVRFHRQVCALGGVVLESSWLGKDNGHTVLCPEGHVSKPRPGDVREGTGICRTCAGKSPQESFLKFKCRLLELNFIALDTDWRGSHTPFKVRCPEGHEGSPLPTNVLQGSFPCSTCSKGTRWDVFYIVSTEDTSQFKLGITSGTGRLEDHRRAGYPIRNRVLIGLPSGGALEIERSCRATLKLAKEEPLYGREYYDGALISTVLDVVDNHPYVREVM